MTKHEWPKRPDGTNKTMREMTADERRAQWTAAAKRVQSEFDHPVVREKLSHVLRGGSVQ